MVGVLQVELCGKSGQELISKSYVSMNCTELTLWGVEDERWWWVLLLLWSGGEELWEEDKSIPTAHNLASPAHLAGL
jgi:hypothetical protein